MSWIYPPLGSRLLLLAILPQRNVLSASRKSEGVPVAFGWYRSHAKQAGGSPGWSLVLIS